MSFIYNAEHYFIRHWCWIVLGALPDEVGIMNGLTINEHLLMVKLFAPEARSSSLGWMGWLKLQDWTLTDDFARVDIAGLDNDGLDIDGRIWAIDCNQLKITIERFYQLTGTYNSFESVLCLKTDEIHIDQQKLWACNEYYLASCLLTLKCVK